MKRSAEGDTTTIPTRRPRVVARWPAPGAMVGGVMLLLLLGVVLFNTWMSSSRQIQGVAPAAPPSVDPDAAVQRLAEAIRLPTISRRRGAAADQQMMRRFSELLTELFPALREAPWRWRGGVDFGDPNNLSILLTWPGANPQLEPILLLAHYDVVPPESASLEQWTHPPFAGVVDDEFVWGRGALDAKNGLMAMLEAVVWLQSEGFEPQRTLHFAFGHDEELGGASGNGGIAQWMQREGVRLWCVCDEGGCILKDFPGMTAPVALVGVAEKGRVTVDLHVQLEEGGHASMPPRETAITVLAAALQRVSRSPFPRRLNGGAGALLDYLGPEMPWAGKAAAANRWLFAPLILQRLGASPSSDALLRTTIAATKVAAGEADNVLPSQAQATLNVRLLPGDTIQDALEHLRRVIDDDRITLQDRDGRPASPRLSSAASPAFAALQKAVKQVFPDVVTAPFVLVGGTDASYYEAISRDVYRFYPVRLASVDLKRIHGIDERISRQDYLNLIHFYVQLLRNTAE